MSARHNAGFAVWAALFLSTSALAAGDVYQDVFNAVDSQNLVSRLKDMAGDNPVTVRGETFTITERQTEASKALYRKYWRGYFEGLGLTVNDESFPGHDLEAVLPGKSPDSIVIVVHYDSAGVIENAGADDDMSGMTTMFEAARILVQHRDQLERTVRFVATDYEESGGLEGAVRYVAYLKKQMAQSHFAVPLTIDYEQSGWSKGGDPSSFYVGNCIKQGPYANTPALIGATAKKYGGGLNVKSWECFSGSDHAAFLDSNLPAFFSSEFNPLANPYFDNSGDLFGIIDTDYLFKISQIMITFTAQVVGIQK